MEECAVFSHRGTRATFGIGQTLLCTNSGERHSFWGGFALEDLPMGAFLGLYCGDFYDEDEVERGLAVVPPSRYSVMASGFLVVPVGPVTREQYPMAMLNEPPKGTVASVALVEWPTKGKIDPSCPKSKDIVFSVAMHTTRAVKKGEELHFCYGKLYDREHYPRGSKVGSPSHIARSEVPLDEVPSSYMSRSGIPLPSDAFG